MKILSLRYGHDSSAAILIDGEIVADVAEERFSRIKNDTSFPIKSIEYCLKKAGISSLDLDALVFPSVNKQHDITSFFKLPKREEEKFFNSWKYKINSFLGRIPSKISLPIYQKPWLISEECEIKFYDHHLCHAASAAYTSGIDINEKVLAFTMDGIGDNTSVAVWEVYKNKIKNLLRIDGKGSLGWFYGLATEGLEWRHGSEEWKVMGLAPYGTPSNGSLDGFHPQYQDGMLKTGHDYKGFGIWKDHGGVHYHGKQSYDLSLICNKLGKENFAAEVQRVSEEQAMNIILPWVKKKKIKKVVCSGGFFMNVKFNQNLWYSNELDAQWIYPNPGDAGLAVGACLYHWYQNNLDNQHERLESLYLGPEFSNEEIKIILEDRSIKYEFHEDIEKITAEYLSKNLVVGWFQGRMESGPRALGNRSILMSPIHKDNKDIINAKVKYREKFRPFCPSILDSKYDDYLNKPRDELFMVTSFEAKKGIQERIPAVIHVDNSARPQKVIEKVNKRYYSLINNFGKLTNEYVLLNTSFNIKGEPIVCNPREAIKCFYDTGLDILVLGNYLIRKETLNERN